MYVGASTDKLPKMLQHWCQVDRASRPSMTFYLDTVCMLYKLSSTHGQFHQWVAEAENTSKPHTGGKKFGRTFFPQWMCRAQFRDYGPAFTTACTTSLQWQVHCALRPCVIRLKHKRIRLVHVRPGDTNNNFTKGDDEKGSMRRRKAFTNKLSNLF